jgi:anti-sigma regulatory factor (Ser/Thr protein kinase)
MNGLAHHALPEIWHAALPYRSTAEFEDAACRFAQDAARVDAAVLIACSTSPLSRMQAQLGGMGERVTWLDISDPGANPGRMIHAISRFADQQAGRPAWCVQEAAWPSRPADELWEVIRYEALMNLALTKLGPPRPAVASPVRVLCPYHVGLPPEVVACAAATHPLTASDGRWQPSPRYRLEPGRHLVPPLCDQPLPPPPSDALEVSYRDDLASVRSLVFAGARAAGLSSGRASDLLMAVGELTANTRAHTSGSGALTMWATRTAVICEVRDSGHITDPLAGQLRPGPAALGGGRGLWVVHQLCDLVQMRTGADGTTVRVHMHLTP